MIGSALKMLISESVSWETCDKSEELLLDSESIVSSYAVALSVNVSVSPTLLSDMVAV